MTARSVCVASGDIVPFERRNKPSIGRAICYMCKRDLKMQRGFPGYNHARYPRHNEVKA